MTDLFDAPQHFDPEEKIPRDRFKRPYVVPPGGIKAVTYMRCTNFVDVLEDKRNLEAWAQRQTALGLAERPDLLLSVTAHRNDKEALNDIVKQAKDAAKSNAKSNTGTALHALCEQCDRGQRLGTIPAAYRQDIRAYQAITRGMTHHYIEAFSVHDPYKVGGTPDRVVEYGGKFHIADLKTGSIEWGALKIAMQLAMYAHSTPYDHIRAKRVPYPFEVDQNRAIVIHLPAGEGIAMLHWVDIAAGWEAVQTAAAVRTWRNRRNWFTTIDTPEPVEPAPVETLGLAGLDWDDTKAATVSQFISTAKSFDDLREIWTAAVEHGVWTDEHIELAKTRRAEIERHAA
jgi:hypothetical protein